MRAHAESVNLQFDNPLDEVIIIIIYIVYWIFISSSWSIGGFKFPNECEFEL